MTENAEGSVEPFDVAQLGSGSFGLSNRRPDRKLQGWHRPRKQFVRSKLVIGSLSDVLRGRDPGDQVNYLGLPGADLLDLVYLRKNFCEPTRRPLRFMGFDTAVGSQYIDTALENVAIQQLKQSTFVSESSKVRSDDIRSVASSTSKAYREVRKFAPYDLINLDLCDGFLREQAGVEQTFYSLLTSLLGLQKGNPHPWMLLITTVVDETAISATAGSIVEEIFRENLQECPNVADLCAALFDAAPPTVAVGRSSAIDLLNLVRIGLSQWLFDLAHTFAKVKLVGSFGYRLRPQAECDDIVTLAFKFTPLNLPLTDSAGLAPSRPHAPIDRCEASAQFVERVRNSVDVDETLTKDVDARIEAVDECANLLLEARYDKGTIKAWLEDEGFADVVAILDVFDLVGALSESN